MPVQSQLSAAAKFKARILSCNQGLSHKYCMRAENFLRNSKVSKVLASVFRRLAAVVRVMANGVFAGFSGCRACFSVAEEVIL